MQGTVQKHLCCAVFHVSADPKVKQFNTRLNFINNKICDTMLHAVCCLPFIFQPLGFADNKTG